MRQASLDVSRLLSMRQVCSRCVTSALGARLPKPTKEGATEGGDQINAYIRPDCRERRIRGGIGHRAVVRQCALGPPGKAYGHLCAKRQPEGLLDDDRGLCARSCFLPWVGNWRNSANVGNSSVAHPPSGLAEMKKDHAWFSKAAGAYGKGPVPQNVTMTPPITISAPPAKTGAAGSAPNTIRLTICQTMNSVAI
jgi:hypothetical protein